jgi:hypothetical protein
MKSAMPNPKPGIRFSQFVNRHFLLLLPCLGLPGCVTAQSLLPDRLWGSYYGGTGNEVILSMCTDPGGNVILCGETDSPENIATPGAWQDSLAGDGDAFLVKFSPDGIRLWGTYFGGPSQDVGWSCRTDTVGNIYLSGHTLSSSGIASPGAHQAILRGERDAFLAKFTTDGQLLWATYYGGSVQEAGYGCDAAPDGTVYLAGYTNSPDYIPTPGAHQQVPGGDYDGFLAKFSSSGQRIWGTYYGGAGTDAASGCRISPQGELYLAGSTNSPGSIATPGSYQPVNGGDFDAFLVQFTTGGQRVWGTYYGGTLADQSVAAVIDPGGNILIGGYTQSADNIASPGSYQPALAGMTDGFLVKFSAAGSREWGTYYGGDLYEEIRALASGENGDVYLGGHTYSSEGIASPGSFQPSSGGDRDAFFTCLDSSGSRKWGTYYGGTGDDAGYGVAGRSPDEVYLAGYAGSVEGIATPGAFQPGFGGGDRDGFMVRFTETPVGIRDATTPGFRIYPNPSPGFVTVTGILSRSVPGRLRIYNLLGEEIFTAPLPARQSIFTGFPGLPRGTYVIHVTSGSDPRILQYSLFIVH